ncbi:hypothetical protein [Nevskia sp.]|uniref:GumC family protein n=1 Tax=Nevskia sp. TaxID=1929292 RepID=UPI0025E9DA6A|nr:hypothetical protein [Nevskia sp.]
MSTRDQFPVVQTQMPAYGGAPVIPQSYTHPGMSVQQLLSISKAYWKVTLIIGFVVFVIVAGMGLRKPKQYDATVTLLINPEVNDPISGKEFPLQLLANYMATQLELISSTVVLQLVVERLKLHENEDYALNLELAEDIRRATAERTLAQGLVIGQGRYGSQLVSVTYRADSPMTAADIANTIAEVYVSKDYERRGPDNEKSLLAFSTQLSDLKQKVTVAQEQMAAFQKRTGIISTDAKGDTTSSALAQLEADLLDAQSKRLALEIAASSGPNANAGDATTALIFDLRGQLSELEAKMSQYRITDGPKNPRVIELQSQIDSTQDAIRKATRSVSQASYADVAGARKLEARLKSAIDEQRKKVITQGQLLEEGQKIRLELESAQSTYRRAFEKFDEISRSSASTYNNLKIVSRATPPTKASSRRTRTTLIMAMVLGGGAGVVLPLAWGLLFRRVRCRDDLERDYGIPVIVEFNAIPAAGR